MITLGTKVPLIGIFITLSFCLFADGVANPWGKDADLCPPSFSLETPRKQKCSTFILGPFAELMIGFHQVVISPADGPRSHFIPSSSQYTLEAMRIHGFFWGVVMGCDRLMRENSDPWIYRKAKGPSGYLKWDPP